jgi:hypothetical protein
VEEYPRYSVPPLPHRLARRKKVHMMAYVIAVPSVQRPVKSTVYGPVPKVYQCNLKIEGFLAVQLVRLGFRRLVLHSTDIVRVEGAIGTAIKRYLISRFLLRSMPAIDLVDWLFSDGVAQEGPGRSMYARGCLLSVSPVTLQVVEHPGYILKDTMMEDTPG